MRHRSLRPILGVLLAAVVVVAWSGVAGAAGTWTADPVSGSTDSVTPVAVAGNGCIGSVASVILSVGSNVNDLPGVVNQQFITDPGGNWSGVINIPAGLAAGEYTLWGQCIVQFNYPNFAFTIAAPIPPAAPVADPIVASARFTG
jgi:hypothetical protein